MDPSPLCELPPELRNNIYEGGFEPGSNKTSAAVQSLSSLADKNLNHIKRRVICVLGSDEERNIYYRLIDVRGLWEEDSSTKGIGGHAQN